MYIDYSKVREKLDFRNVLQHYALTYSEGKNQVKIHCPFHEDKTPSLSIDIEGKRFKCFGCSAKGNALEFVLLMEGGKKSDKEAFYSAVQKALEISGSAVVPSDDTKQQKGSASRKQPVRPTGGDSDDDNDVSKEQSGHTKPLKRSTTNEVLELELRLNPNHTFLQHRGITPEICKTFEMGYCARGIMKHRIAIPIHNLNGERVAYSGRYAEEEVPEDVMRYKVPTDFHRSLEVFNLHRAQRLGKKHLVLVEGFWSTFRLHGEGIPVGALMGDSVSPEQAKLIRKAGFRFVTLILDGDETGRSATPEAVNMLSREVYVHVVELPNGVKPDTMSEEVVSSLR